jgi:glutamate dehydrogenase (NAD(P)+)
MGYFWTEERVNRRADRVMKSAFDVVFEAGKKHSVSLRTAAYIVAIDKVATTQKFRGVF